MTRQYELKYFPMWVDRNWSSTAILVCFKPKKSLFLEPQSPGKGKNGPNPCSLMHWGVIWRTRHFPGGLVQPGAAQPFQSCSSHKIGIFGPLDPWICAWKWQKWPQVMLSHVLGCDMAHWTLSRWANLAWTSPAILVLF